MRPSLWPFLGCILPGMLLCSPGLAQEQPSLGKAYWGIAPGVGYFEYLQHVDGGYSINGQPCKLVWSGLQLQLSGHVHYQPAKSEYLSFGLAAAGMLAPNARGVDRARSLSIDPDELAPGGYLALSMGIRPSAHWRLAVQNGLGMAGAPSALGFGGWGLMFGLATHYLFGTGALASGVGLRFGAMFLSSARDGMVRAESGLYSWLLLEFLLEAVERVDSAPPTSPSPTAGPSKDQPW